MRMRKLLMKLCSVAIVIAAIAPNACRGNWYQPEEPVGFSKFVKNCKK